MSPETPQTPQVRNPTKFVPSEELDSLLAAKDAAFKAMQEAEKEAQRLRKAEERRLKRQNRRKK